MASTTEKPISHNKISTAIPVAVLTILKNVGVSKSVASKITGESLFNDGVAVVVFITIQQLAQSNSGFEIGNVIASFSQEAIGGLIIGNHGKELGMSTTTAACIDKFWELLDEILNAVLFVLIGLALLVIEINKALIFAAVIILFLTLMIRYFSVWVPYLAIRFKEKMTYKTLIILTWGGLCGGISIALALSIQKEFNTEIWVTITYVIVCFCILVQGNTIGKVTRKFGDVYPFQT